MHPEDAETAGRSIPQLNEPRQLVRAGWLAAVEADTTRKVYTFVIDKFFDWCDEQGVDALDPKRIGIDLYRGQLHREHGRTTVAKKLSALSSFYKYGLMEHEGIVPDNPVMRIKRPKTSKESTRSGLDLEETRCVLERASQLGGRDAAVTYLLVETGMRSAELRNACVIDLATERGQRTLTVTRKGGKRQALVIPVTAVAVLDAYLSGRSDGPLITGNKGGVLTRYEMAVIVRRVTAGLDKHLSPHSLRHTYATLALDSGEDIREVQRAMGHVHLDTTMRYDRSRSRVDRSPSLGLSRYLKGGS